jgi:arsenite methyltransferase
MIRSIGIKNKAIESRIGHIKFFSATYRLWKLPLLEPDCEDYGQVFHLCAFPLPMLIAHMNCCHKAVRYKGTILNSSRNFKLDGHHVFEAGKVRLYFNAL